MTVSPSSLRLPAIVMLACAPLPALAQSTKADDEPPVEKGKVEWFGQRGRIFATEGSRHLVLMSRRSYAAEHAAGFSGMFMLIGKGFEQRTYRLRGGLRLGARGLSPGARDRERQERAGPGLFGVDRPGAEPGRKNRLQSILGGLQGAVPEVQVAIRLKPPNVSRMGGRESRLLAALRQISRRRPLRQFQVCTLRPKRN